jgi:hypothetical protein
MKLIYYKEPSKAVMKKLNKLQKSVNATFDEVE